MTRTILLTDDDAKSISSVGSSSHNCRGGGSSDATRYHQVGNNTVDCPTIGEEKNTDETMQDIIFVNGLFIEDDGEKSHGNSRISGNHLYGSNPIIRRSVGKKEKPCMKGHWNEREDRILMKMVDVYGTKNWSTIAAKMGKRTGKQCRERWHNHLRLNIKKELEVMQALVSNSSEGSVNFDGNDYQEMENQETTDAKQELIMVKQEDESLPRNESEEQVSRNQKIVNEADNAMHIAAKEVIVGHNTDAQKKGNTVKTDYDTFLHDLVNWADAQTSKDDELIINTIHYDDRQDFIAEKTIQVEEEIEPKKDMDLYEMIDFILNRT